MKKAVLLLAYGTPDSLDDMEAYILDIRGGRETPKALVDEIRGRYEQIGGSPLNELTQAQAAAVEQTLRQHEFPVDVYVGMRHWKPWIKETVQQMAMDGVEEAVALVLAPHYSALSIGKYQERLSEAVQEIGANITFKVIHSWWRQPKFLQALQQKVLEGIESFPLDVQEEVKVVFTAHSLPSRILEMEDPYDDELKNNASAIAERMEDIDATFAYQSAGASKEPWLGPALEDVIPQLAEEGCRYVLVAPIGFVCDHVEILYDIDIEAKEIAKQHGIELHRTESMNSTPLFIEAMSDAIEDVLSGKVDEEMKADGGLMMDQA